MSLKKWNHSLTEYVLLEQLGRGTYGTVYKAHKKKNMNQLVAIKCIHKTNVLNQSIDNIINEISITKRIKSRYIVELLDFKWTETHIYLILEYCSGGELAQLIKRNKRFPETVVRHFLQQIATALKIMRINSIVHLDLKPQNILISSKLSANCWRNIVLKIADFGFAQYITNEDFGTSLRGSPLYMAPEILLRNKYEANVDLWSVGIILYECLFGSAPFSSDSFEELAQKIKSQEPIEIPETIVLSDNCRDLLSKLLQRNPQKRISFEEFFEHPFIDLEHMPSPESYAKGVRLIQEAVERDSKCDYSQSFKLYSEGLEYLVPVYDWGDGTTVWDTKQQKILKNKLIEYIERAENIKNKCNLTVVDNKDLQSIETAYQLIEKANHLIKIKAYKEAFNDYNKAIEFAIKVLPKLKGDQKNTFYEELNNWITKAEYLKNKSQISDKTVTKQSFKLKESAKQFKCEGDGSLSSNSFISKFSNSRDLRSSPTCYVQ